MARWKGDLGFAGVGLLDPLFVIRNPPVAPISITSVEYESTSGLSRPKCYEDRIATRHGLNSPSMLPRTGE